MFGRLMRARSRDDGLILVDAGPYTLALVRDVHLFQQELTAHITGGMVRTIVAVAFCRCVALMDG